MSHVVDGQIHAWLDGALLAGSAEREAFEAHVAECDVCRARVEAERVIRDRATDVLRTVSPDAVRVEPFERMIAARRAARAAAEAKASADAAMVPGRVDSATPATRPPRRRYLPLAWAASLLMAVSAGWFARAYLPSFRAASVPGESDRVVAELESQPPASLESAAVTTSPAEAPSAATEGAGPGSGVPPAARQSPATVRRDAAEPDRRGLADTREGAKTEAAGQVAGGVMRAPEETRRLAEAMVRNEARVQEVAVTPARVNLMQDTDPLSEADAAALASYRSAAWEAVTEDEAAARLGRVAARIEGLPIDTLQAARHGSGWLIRVVQRLESGEGAEILQWRERVELEEFAVTGEAAMKVAAQALAADSVGRRGVVVDSALPPRQRVAEAAAAAAPQPAEAPADERLVLQLRSPGFRVLLRAGLSADSLASVAQRIR